MQNSGLVLSAAPNLSRGILKEIKIGHIFALLRYSLKLKVLILLVVIII